MALFGVLAAIGAAAYFRDHLLPESSAAARGHQVALRAGCFSCHGTGADPGVHNPVRRAPDAPLAASCVPTATSATVPSLQANAYGAAVLKQWIEDGISERSAQSAAHRASRERKLLQMPAYKHRLAEQEVDDLVVYLLLMRAASRPRSEMPEGERLARDLGCFTCHGELGQGGVENPGSMKGYIPGFFGRDFALLTGGADRERVKEWIRDGVTREMLEAPVAMLPVARWILERQAIAMPAFDRVLDEEQLDTLADYVLELHRLGSLGAEHLEPLSAATRAEALEEPIGAEGARPEVSFVQDIQPILEYRCVRCHGPRTQKSDYRLDTRDAAVRGGTISSLQRRPAVVLGDAEASLFLQFVESVEVDEEREIYPMPPKEEGRLSRGQIERLRTWIDTGMDWPPGATLRERRSQDGRPVEDRPFTTERRDE